MVHGFVISLISEAVRKGTGKDWDKERTAQKPSKIQLGKHQMEGPNDAESAGLRSEEKAALTAGGLY